MQSVMSIQHKMTETTTEILGTTPPLPTSSPTITECQFQPEIMTQTESVEPQHQIQTIETSWALKSQEDQAMMMAVNANIPMMPMPYYSTMPQSMYYPHMPMPYANFPYYPPYPPMHPHAPKYWRRNFNPYFRFRGAPRGKRPYYQPHGYHGPRWQHYDNFRPPFHPHGPQQSNHQHHQQHQHHDIRNSGNRQSYHQSGPFVAFDPSNGITETEFVNAKMTEVNNNNNTHNVTASNKKECTSPNTIKTTHTKVITTTLEKSIDQQFSKVKDLQIERIKCRLADDNIIESHKLFTPLENQQSRVSESEKLERAKLPRSVSQDSSRDREGQKKLDPDRSRRHHSHGELRQKHKFRKSSSGEKFKSRSHFHSEPKDVNLSQKIFTKFLESKHKRSSSELQHRKTKLSKEDHVKCKESQEDYLERDRKSQLLSSVNRKTTKRPDPRLESNYDALLKSTLLAISDKSQMPNSLSPMVKIQKLEDIPFSTIQKEAACPLLKTRPRLISSEKWSSIEKNSKIGENDSHKQSPQKPLGIAEHATFSEASKKLSNSISLQKSSPDDSWKIVTDTLVTDKSSYKHILCNSKDHKKDVANDNRNISETKSSIPTISEGHLKSKETNSSQTKKSVKSFWDIKQLKTKQKSTVDGSIKKFSRKESANKDGNLDNKEEPSSGECSEDVFEQVSRDMQMVHFPEQFVNLGKHEKFSSCTHSLPDNSSSELPDDKVDLKNDVAYSPNSPTMSDDHCSISSNTEENTEQDLEVFDECADENEIHTVESGNIIEEFICEGNEVDLGNDNFDTDLFGRDDEKETKDNSEPETLMFDLNEAQGLASASAETIWCLVLSDTDKEPEDSESLDKDKHNSYLKSVDGFTTIIYQGAESFQAEGIVFQDFTDEAVTPVDNNGNLIIVNSTETDESNSQDNNVSKVICNDQVKPVHDNGNQINVNNTESDETRTPENNDGEVICKDHVQSVNDNANLTIVNNVETNEIRTPDNNDVEVNCNDHVQSVNDNVNLTIVNNVETNEKVSLQKCESEVISSTQVYEIQSDADDKDGQGSQDSNHGHNIGAISPDSDSSECEIVDNETVVFRNSTTSDLDHSSESLTQISSGSLSLNADQNGHKSIAAESSEECETLSNEIVLNETSISNLSEPKNNSLTRTVGNDSSEFESVSQDTVTKILDLNSSLQSISQVSSGSLNLTDDSSIVRDSSEMKIECHKTVSATGLPMCLTSDISVPIPQTDSSKMELHDDRGSDSADCSNFKIKKQKIVTLPVSIPMLSLSDTEESVHQPSPIVVSLDHTEDATDELIEKNVDCLTENKDIIPDDTELNTVAENAISLKGYIFDFSQADQAISKKVFNDLPDTKNQIITDKINLDKSDKCARNPNLNKKGRKHLKRKSREHTRSNKLTVCKVKGKISADTKHETILASEDSKTEPVKDEVTLELNHESDVSVSGTEIEPLPEVTNTKVSNIRDENLTDIKCKTFVDTAEEISSKNSDEENSKPVTRIHSKSADDSDMNSTYESNAGAKINEISDAKFEETVESNEANLDCTKSCFESAEDSSNTLNKQSSFENADAVTLDKISKCKPISSDTDESNACSELSLSAKNSKVTEFTEMLSETHESNQSINATENATSISVQETIATDLPQKKVETNELSCLPHNSSDVCQRSLSNIEELTDEHPESCTLNERIEAPLQSVNETIESHCDIFTEDNVVNTNKANDSEDVSELAALTCLSNDETNDTNNTLMKEQSTEGMTSELKFPSPNENVPLEMEMSIEATDNSMHEKHNEIHPDIENDHFSVPDINELVVQISKKSAINESEHSELTNEAHSDQTQEAKLVVPKLVDIVSKVVFAHKIGVEGNTEIRTKIADEICLENVSAEDSKVSEDVSDPHQQAHVEDGVTIHIEDYELEETKSQILHEFLQFVDNESKVTTGPMESTKLKPQVKLNSVSKHKKQALRKSHFKSKWGKKALKEMKKRQTEIQKLCVENKLLNYSDPAKNLNSSNEHNKEGQYRFRFRKVKLPQSNVRSITRAAHRKGHNVLSEVKLDNPIPLEYKTRKRINQTKKGILERAVEEITKNTDMEESTVEYHSQDFDHSTNTNDNETYGSVHSAAVGDATIATPVSTTMVSSSTNICIASAKPPQVPVSEPQINTSIADTNLRTAKPHDNPVVHPKTSADSNLGNRSKADESDSEISIIEIKTSNLGSSVQSSNPQVTMANINCQPYQTVLVPNPGTTSLASQPRQCYPPTTHANSSYQYLLHNPTVLSNASPPKHQQQATTQNSQHFSGNLHQQSQFRGFVPNTSSHELHQLQNNYIDFPHPSQYNTDAIPMSAAYPNIPNKQRPVQLAWQNNPYYKINNIENAHPIIVPPCPQACSVLASGNLSSQLVQINPLGSNVPLQQIRPPWPVSTSGPKRLVNESSQSTVQSATAAPPISVSCYQTIPMQMPNLVNTNPMTKSQNLYTSPNYNQQVIAGSNPRNIQVCQPSESVNLNSMHIPMGSHNNGRIIAGNLVDNNQQTSQKAHEPQKQQIIEKSNVQMVYPLKNQYQISNPPITSGSPKEKSNPTSDVSSEKSNYPNQSTNGQSCTVNSLVPSGSPIARAIPSFDISNNGQLSNQQQSLQHSPVTSPKDILALQTAFRLSQAPVNGYIVPKKRGRPPKKFPGVPLEEKRVEQGVSQSPKKSESSTDISVHAPVTMNTAENRSPSLSKGHTVIQSPVSEASNVIPTGRQQMLNDQQQPQPSATTAPLDLSASAKQAESDGILRNLLRRNAPCELTNELYKSILLSVEQLMADLPNNLPEDSRAFVRHHYIAAINNIAEYMQVMKRRTEAENEGKQTLSSSMSQSTPTADHPQTPLKHLNSEYEMYFDFQAGKSRQQLMQPNVSGAPRSTMTDTVSSSSRISERSQSFENPDNSSSVHHGNDEQVATAKELSPIPPLTRVPASITSPTAIVQQSINPNSQFTRQYPGNPVYTSRMAPIEPPSKIGNTMEIVVPRLNLNNEQTPEKNPSLSNTRRPQWISNRELEYIIQQRNQKLCTMPYDDQRTLMNQEHPHANEANKLLLPANQNAYNSSNSVVYNSSGHQLQANKSPNQIVYHPMPLRPNVIKDHQNKYPMAYRQSIVAGPERSLEQCQYPQYNQNHVMLQPAAAPSDAYSERQYRYQMGQHRYLQQQQQQQQQHQRTELSTMVSPQDMKNSESHRVQVPIARIQQVVTIPQQMSAAVVHQQNAYQQHHQQACLQPNAFTPSNVDKQYNVQTQNSNAVNVINPQIVTDKYIIPTSENR